MVIDMRCYKWAGWQNYVQNCSDKYVMNCLWLDDGDVDKGDDNDGDGLL